MTDPTNQKTQYEKYFAQGFDLSKKMNFWQKLRLLPKTIYNREAVKKIEKLIVEEKPDIAHAHNIEYYLTPAIYKVLKKHNIPVVMTLHNYNLVCPNYKMFVRGRVCEKCKKTKYYQCFLNRCLKNSWTMSFMGMVVAYFNRIFGMYNYVDLFIAPSYFMKEKCVEFGIEPRRIEVVRYNFASTIAHGAGVYEEGDYFLYFGRLSDEKGIDQLIEAVTRLKKEGALKDKKLYIVGKGPEEANLKAIVEKNGMRNEIVFMGFKKGDELTRIVGESMFVIAPSMWYENAPFVVLEAQLLKKPVIVSDLGGTKEFIDQGKSGFVYTTENVANLAENIKLMLEKGVEERHEMGEQGKRKAEERIADSERITEIYQKLIIS